MIFFFHFKTLSLWWTPSLIQDKREPRPALLGSLEFFLRLVEALLPEAPSQASFRRLVAQP
jgi:hypothetical protein